MALDYSCTTVNMVHIARRKARTIRNMLNKYPPDMPLFLDDGVICSLYIAGKMEFQMIRSGRDKGIYVTEIPVHYYRSEAANCFKYPNKVMEGIGEIRKICPVSATWLMFNIKDFFRD